MKKLIISSLAFLFLCLGCEEIISVADISEDTVNILGPVEGTTVRTHSVDFSWNLVDFADSYQVQVASPSFENASAIVLDTIVTDSTQSIRSIRKPLAPDAYEWRIKARNSEFETIYSSANFVVDTTAASEDISGLQVNLIAPTNNAILNSEEVVFTWSDIDGADQYVLQVAYPDFENPVQVIVDEILDATSFATTLVNNNYQWRVKALNSSSETLFNTQDFSVDTNAAVDISQETVSLLAPGDGTVLTETQVQFTWDAVDNAEQYELQVATPTFENPLQFVVNTRLSTTESPIVTLVEGTYQWRVKAINSSSETNYSTRDFDISLGSDLSDQTVQLIAPSEGTTVASETLNFTWQSLAAASQYQLQIAQPNFANPVQIVVDQIFTDASSQSFTLPEGDYEWRVKALNTTSETAYSTNGFVVDTNANLSDQEVLIISPVDGFVTTNTSVNLQWEELPQATLYRVIITDTAGAVFLEETTSNGVLGVNFVPGNYTWKVRAENSAQNTPFTEQTITIL